MTSPVMRKIRSVNNQYFQRLRDRAEEFERLCEEAVLREPGISLKYLKEITLPARNSYVKGEVSLSYLKEHIPMMTHIMKDYPQDTQQFAKDIKAAIRSKRLKKGLKVAYRAAVAYYVSSLVIGAIFDKRR